MTERTSVHGRLDRFFLREKLLTVEDYRRVAKRRLPRVAFDFVDGGSESELSVRENRRAFEEVWLRPYVGTTVHPDLTTTVFGSTLSMPVIVGPTGMARIVNPAGDLAAVRAAGKAGTVFALATRSGHSIEEIAAARSGPVWYQVYSYGGRAAVENALGRAARAGYGAIVVTLDTQAGGKRERDLRNGTAELLGGSRWKALPYVPQLLRAPGWFARRIADGLIPMTPNVTQQEGGPPRLSSSQQGSEPDQHSLGWVDLGWVRAVWDGPIAVKGVLTREDAERAVDAGVQGIIVSNHGGRQLDGAIATLRALPEVVAAVDGRCEVLLDGGIRRGSDVVKALSLGARAVLIGRPWVYGLGAAGQAGIEGVLEILRSDIIRVMRLMGRARIEDLDGSAVRAPSDWFRWEPAGSR